MFPARPGERKQPPNRGQRQIRIIFLDFLERGSKFGVLNECVRENSGPSDDHASGNLPGNSFHQLATRPIDLASVRQPRRILVCSVAHLYPISRRRSSARSTTRPESQPESPSSLPLSP